MTRYCDTEKTKKKTTDGSVVGLTPDEPGDGIFNSSQSKKKQKKPKSAGMIWKVPSTDTDMFLTIWNRFPNFLRFFFLHVMKVQLHQVKDLFRLIL